MTASDPFVLRLGSRGSPLARQQAEQVAAAIALASGGSLGVEIETFTTSGDRLTTERLIAAGGKGLFTREIDEALNDRRIDIAVHSLKDVPVDLPAGQIFIAFPKREDPREGFVAPGFASLADLPEGARVGTASLRREAQTRYLRPDLEIVTFRGNVNTRLAKLRDGQADATYLAMAGLNRLGLSHAAQPIALEAMLPAAAQGILGVVVHEAINAPILEILRTLNDADAAAAAIAERAFLAGLDGNCRTPIAAHLFAEENDWRLEGEVLSPDGRQRWRASGRCRIGASDVQLAALGLSLATELRHDAGGALVAFRDGG